MQRNQQIIIRELPEGTLSESHFELKEGEMPAPGPGQLLIKTRLMSIDAANRAWMQGATYRAAVNAGDVMPTFAIGEVVESRAPDFAAGDLIAAESGWSEYFVVDAAKAQRQMPLEPISNLLSIYGIAGKTAYHGLVRVGLPTAGETVVVSAAAGSVGMFVGQIAKALGCRAVGIAGGAEKCEWVTQTLGFDACVDYRAGKLFKDLKVACPDGIDVYFDNVGGNILETVLFQMNQRGRIVCCGAVSQYDGSAPTGPRNLPGLVVVKRLRMEGFIVMDHFDQDAETLAALKAWVDAGKIHVAEDVIDGLAAAPRALIGLLAGENRGKRMVSVA